MYQLRVREKTKTKYVPLLYKEPVEEHTNSVDFLRLQEQHPIHSSSMEKLLQRKEKMTQSMEAVQEEKVLGSSLPYKKIERELQQNPKEHQQKKLIEEINQKLTKKGKKKLNPLEEIAIKKQERWDTNGRHYTRQNIRKDNKALNAICRVMRDDMLAEELASEEQSVRKNALQKLIDFVCQLKMPADNIEGSSWIFCIDKITEDTYYTVGMEFEQYLGEKNCLQNADDLVDLKNIQMARDIINTIGDLLVKYNALIALAGTKRKYEELEDKDDIVDFIEDTRKRILCDKTTVMEEFC